MVLIQSPCDDIHNWCNNNPSVGLFYITLCPTKGRNLRIAGYMHKQNVMQQMFSQICQSIRHDFKHTLGMFIKANLF